MLQQVNSSAAGRGLHLWNLSSPLWEIKLSKPCYVTPSSDSKTGEVRGSVSQTLHSPLTLWRCWVFPAICALFPAGRVPPLASTNTKRFFCDLLVFLSLSSQLISLLPTPPALFLSPSLSCHDISLWHMWETLAGPLPAERYWYTESAAWLGYFGNSQIRELPSVKWIHAAADYWPQSLKRSSSFVTSSSVAVCWLSLFFIIF